MPDEERKARPGIVAESSRSVLASAPERDLQRIARLSWAGHGEGRKAAKFCNGLLFDCIMSIAVRIFRSVWFLSVLAVFVMLLYQYASWPEEVVVGQEAVNFISFSRENVFYIFLAIAALVNVSVFVARHFAKSKEELLAWFYGLIGIVNFFLIIAVSFISLFNSNESFRYERIGVIVYGSMFLFGAWIVGGIFYWLIQRKRLRSPMN